MHYMLVPELPVEFKHKRTLAEFVNLIRELNELATKLEENVKDFTHYYKRREERAINWFKMNLVDVDLKITAILMQLNAIYAEYKKALSEILSLQLTQT
jgi:hypothetical protein